jgi:hypothetical protein
MSQVALRRAALLECGGLPPLSGTQPKHFELSCDYGLEQRKCKAGASGQPILGDRDAMVAFVAPGFSPASCFGVAFRENQKSRRGRRRYEKREQAAAFRPALTVARVETKLSRTRLRILRAMI